MCLVQFTHGEFYDNRIGVLIVIDVEFHDNRVVAFRGVMESNRR